MQDKSTRLCACGCGQPTSGPTVRFVRWHVNRNRPLADRFWAKVNKTDACWLWTAKLDTCGYGRITDGQGGHIQAHRAAYELLVGPIPEGLTIDHLCRVRHCVNPAHLEPVTAKENTLRGMSLAAQYARRTHCAKGHPFDEANTGSKGGGRRCKACAREDANKRYRRKKVEQNA